MNTAERYVQLVPPKQQSIRAHVAERLTAAIFRAEIPAGSKLVVQKIARQFSVSSTPVREALVTLESTGVVVFEHNRGAVVKPFGPDELREIYHVRRILETEAARCACGRIEHATLDSLQQEMRELREDQRETKSWSQREMESDRALHSLIASECGSSRLADEIGRYESLMQTIREIVGNRRQAQERALSEHLPIVDALLKNKSDAAAAAMARHIDSTAKSATAVIFGRPDQAKHQ